MKNIRHLYLYLSLLGILLALLVIFRSVFLALIVEPLALAFWAAWRILSSVNQEIYWGMLIAAAGWLTIRMLPMHPARYRKTYQADRPDASPRLTYWQSLLRGSSRKADQRQLLHQNLKTLLAATVALEEKARTAEVQEALDAGRIALPASVQAFLSAGQQEKQRPRLLRWGALFLARLRRRSGYDNTTYYNSIEDILKWMESSVEIYRDE